jgi:hypothetical protein
MYNSLLRLRVLLCQDLLLAHVDRPLHVLRVADELRERVLVLGRVFLRPPQTVLDLLQLLRVRLERGDHPHPLVALLRHSVFGLFQVHLKEE